MGSEMCIRDRYLYSNTPEGRQRKLVTRRYRVDRPFLFYNADTDFGSSGSIVVRKFKLVAVHSKGSHLEKCNKGTLCSAILNHINHGICPACKYLRPEVFVSNAFKLSLKGK